ncbi:MAG: DUF2207 domain-containing protein [Candidatus Paceibacterota bacterium]
MLMLLVLIVAPRLLQLVIDWNPLYIFFCVTLVLTMLVAVGFAYQRRTRKGHEAAMHLKGFRGFLSVTEKERLTFHNAPQKNAEQFMEYLPYAVAFGVEKEWADVFKDIQIASPDWYEGNTTTFSAVALSRDIGAFSSSFTASTSSPSGSGSSGGGFSGGGAGGGGGGSW